MKNIGMSKPTRNSNNMAICPVAANHIIAKIQKAIHVISMVFARSPMKPTFSPKPFSFFNHKIIHNQVVRTILRICAKRLHDANICFFLPQSFLQMSCHCSPAGKLDRNRNRTHPSIPFFFRYLSAGFAFETHWRIQLHRTVCYC